VCLSVCQCVCVYVSVRAKTEQLYWSRIGVTWLECVMVNHRSWEQFSHCWWPKREHKLCALPPTLRTKLRCLKSIAVRRVCASHRFIFNNESLCRCLVVERKVVRDNLRPTQVSFESSGKFCHLSSNERVGQLDAVSVLQFDVSRYIRHGAREDRVAAQPGDSHLPRWL